MNAAGISVLPHRDRLGVRPGRLFIDGAWAPAESGARFEQVHPASNEVVADVALAGAADVDRAVRAARRAFDEGPWPGLPAQERIRFLRRFIDLARAEAEALTELQVLDNSNPVRIQRANYLVNGATVTAVFEHAVGWIDKLGGETLPTFADVGRPLMTLTVREPIGVVATIAPWNSPLFLLCQKVAPALAAGCTVVIKPSEHTNLTAIRLVELLESADLPRGVVNLVTGPGEPTGEALVTHPGVDKITFTGSRAVGRRIVRASAEGVKRVSLELGGKSPLILFPDAPDPAQAAAAAMSMVSFGMSGQTCAATTRMLVHESLVDQAIAAALAVPGQVVHGDPYSGETTSAPLISATQFRRVQGIVERAVEAGAQVLTGGGRNPAAPPNGNFFAPTLIAGAPNTSEVASEEIFGPVLTVIPFRDEDEAVALANGSAYGLAATVATGDMARALRLSRRIRAGTVSVNASTLAPNIPFGGFKESGLGREGGRAGLEAFTELKTIHLG